MEKYPVDTERPPGDIKNLRNDGGVGLSSSTPQVLVSLTSSGHSMKAIDIKSLYVPVLVDLTSLSPAHQQDPWGRLPGTDYSMSSPPWTPERRGVIVLIPGIESLHTLSDRREQPSRYFRPCSFGVITPTCTRTRHRDGSVVLRETQPDIRTPTVTPRSHGYWSFQTPYLNSGVPKREWVGKEYHPSEGTETWLGSIRRQDGVKNDHKYTVVTKKILRVTPKDLIVNFSITNEWWDRKGVLLSCVVDEDESVEPRRMSHYRIFVLKDKFDVVITINCRIKDYTRKKLGSMTVNSIDIDC